MTNDHYPIAIVVSDKEKGRIYAESLGIYHYALVTNIEDVKDMFVKGVIVSPGYLESVLMKLDSGLSTFYAANRATLHIPAIKG